MEGTKGVSSAEVLGGYRNRTEKTCEPDVEEKVEAYGSSPNGSTKQYLSVV